ncbi:MAG: hypothetical protein MUC58_10610 [Rhizobiaceae bacterium]|jgi:hypothetical protein|nr:hypothetical protein [Rhizobiaceae bacterium]
MLDISSVPIVYTALNLVLAMAMYTLMARFLLMIVFDDDSQTVFWKVFRQVSDPLIRLVGAVTPAVVPTGVQILFGIVWIVGIRVLILLTFISFGWISLGGVQ